MPEITYEWRPTVDDTSLNRLLAEAFGGTPVPKNWNAQLSRHSVGWVCAREEELLVGFVNVVGDGDVHAVLFDTAVMPTVQRRGVGTRLVTMALLEAKAAGYKVMHVDYEEHLVPFYIGSCGLKDSEAGVLDLTTWRPEQ